jgi:hypothetical protein
MKKYDDLWQNINNLLSFLNQTDVVGLVRNHYAQFDNTAPPEILQMEIDELQKRLDEAEYHV